MLLQNSRSPLPALSYQFPLSQEQELSVPTQPGTVPVKSVFGWIIIHQHLGDGFDWRLPWADYKAGFGNTTSDFWLGLERLHLLTIRKRFNALGLLPIMLQLLVRFCYCFMHL